MIVQDGTDGAMNQNKISIEADLILRERSKLHFDEDPEVNIVRRDGEWRYTARCGVRSDTSGQHPDGNLSVEIDMVRPVDPDHPFTVTVPANEIIDAIEVFVSELKSYLGPAASPVAPNAVG